MASSSGQRGAMSQNSQQLSLKQEWAGFDLMKVGEQHPMVHYRDDLLIISGCVTTATPTSQAGWDLAIAFLDPRACPQREVTVLAPTAMSRYEGIKQCGTSMTLKPDGKLTIHFLKNRNPMVLHLSGVCCSISREEPIPLTIAEHEKRDWSEQSNKKMQDATLLKEDANRAVKPNEFCPPALHKTGNIVCLHGELEEATFSPCAQYVGLLPPNLRPRRELRFLAGLLKSATDQHPRVLEHSAAITLCPDGKICVQGGKVHQFDQKGVMRVYQQNKKGRLCLDGLRFSLSEGVPIQLSHHVAGDACHGSAAKDDAVEKAKAKMSYLWSDNSKSDHTAVCIKEGDVILLEGYLSWISARPPNAKQPITMLPKGAWPCRREVFFTRGSDLEERRRVDVDKFGRVFCPEGVSDGRVELTGVIFIAAAEQTTLKPRDPEWDDLKLQYHHNYVNVVSTSFDGYELLEQFVRRSNHHEWKFIEYDFSRQSGRKMLMPLGPVPLRGHPKTDPMNLSLDRNQRIWREYKEPLCDKFGIEGFHTLLHFSDAMFEKIAQAVSMSEDDRRYLASYRFKKQQSWSAKRQPGLTFAYLQGLASEIADQMFEHWDFKAQLQGALQNDFRPPATIEHMFPQRKSGKEYFIKKHIKDHEMAKFEEVRQFFFLYETTGSNMTHCSLMGSGDMFSSTGKWHFPDAPDVQKQLFENIAWLFPRKMYLYMSERQTQRFPFIEDLDIQAYPNWQGELGPGEKRHPPDDIIMSKPRRDGHEVVGGPGEFMEKRALAIHRVYPHITELEVLVYSASGYNKGKDMWKSSFHLVWPQLIVDSDYASVIRRVTLGSFREETLKKGTFLHDLHYKLVEVHKSNDWELVFDSTTINARNGLRMPYNDKASMVVASEELKKQIKDGKLSKSKAEKRRVREDRPSVAIGKIVFDFDKDESGKPRLASARWVADVNAYSIADWIGMGTCRRDPTCAVPAELTQQQLGPDELSMLPKKPGEQFEFEGEDDGEGGQWVTHRPFPQVRQCGLTTQAFQRAFNEALRDELQCILQQNALKEEHRLDLLHRLVGSWVSVTADQAIWRAVAYSQYDLKVPDALWGRNRMARPAEVVFLKKKGKVIVEGKEEVVEKLLRALKTFTKPDDIAVMPIYDVARMSA